MLFVGSKRNVVINICIINIYYLNLVVGGLTLVFK